jgi:hypothetical protein
VEASHKDREIRQGLFPLIAAALTHQLVTPVRAVLFKSGLFNRLFIAAVSIAILASKGEESSVESSDEVIFTTNMMCVAEFWRYNRKTCGQYDTAVGLCLYKHSTNYVRCGQNADAETSAVKR